MFEKLLARMVAIYGETHEMIDIFCREAELLSEDVLEIIVERHEEVWAKTLEDPWDEDEEYLNGADEMGFDPYTGCYTWDC